MEWINEQLQRLHVEAAAKEAKLDDLEKELCKKPKDHVLRGKHARLVENLADLNARQKNLEEKLAAAAMGGSGVVAAAATDGSGVVSAPSTVSLDQGATRFFAALRTVAVPDAGNLLTVGSGDVSFLLHNPNYQLYVRKCYPDLFYALYESTSKKHVVTGTPGIGKSYFFYYMLLRLLHSPSPPPFILWEHYGFPGVMEKARDVLGEAALGGQASVHLRASRVSCPPVFDRGRLSIEVSTIAGLIPQGGSAALVGHPPCRLALRGDGVASSWSCSTRQASRVSCPPVFDRGRLSIEVSTIAGRITGVVPVGGVRTGPCRPRACAGAGVTWRYWRTVESLFCKPTGKAAAGEPEVKLSAAEAAPRSPLLDGFVRVELDEQLAAAAAAATYSLTSGGKAAGRRGGAGSPAAAVVVLVPAVGLSFTGGAAIIPEPLPPAPGRPWFGHAGSKLITEAWLRSIPRRLVPLHHLLACGGGYRNSGPWECSEELAQLTVALHGSAVTDSSSITYESGWRHFVHFCTEVAGVPEAGALPRQRGSDLNRDLVCLFIAHAVGRYTASTVIGTLSTLADWQWFMGVSPEAYISRDPLVKRTLGQALLRGWSRHRPRRRHPCPWGC
ncbi:hypothetical protein VOLCADRAFT_108619 [Volvox carteri f. nagariensis]|uniref:Uncharacterized protein n=1 Tax=Volvox carteri f. nagariensis TaxID=3068 RepID=D8ULA1_VOLCA|nr:uncharacterized protein VOLCADRAFT_108619 [Volvox carteri f. nagariensis]EFJ39497.1 hypothetical protein VOLCADRAFT_108619 [Volvox carteri f. nagariensis]|eukprot:XP_002959436.1 hypothetical protein VOLCADRAFT_108619 [Volvox carteri f. nagariensis]